VILATGFGLFAELNSGSPFRQHLSGQLPVSLAAPCVIGAGDLGDILVAQFPVYSINERAELPGINEERLASALAKASVFLAAGDEPEAHRNLSGVKKLARERDHAVHKVGLDDRLPDLSFTGLVRGHRTVGQDESGQSGRSEVINEVLHPGVIGVSRWGHAVDPPLVLLELVATPVAIVERRVCQHPICLQVGEAVVVEGVAVGDLGVYAADRKIHLRQTPGGVVRFLPVDRDVAELAAVRLDELLAADEHSARSAAGIVNRPLYGARISTRMRTT
jgi:hypothetical protein